MDVTRDLPLGFGMALAQNTNALERFGAMSRAQQQAVIDRARTVRSKEEMDALVAGIR
ncbi:MAG: hypothetical protein PHO41_08550 [Eubacteriales bacterium]|nr:hypothetical protein [Eubacteriales bacterium]